MNQFMINKIKQMFPNVNIEDAVNKANDALNGKSGQDAPQILKSIGVDKKGIDEIFDKYGSSAQAKTLLGMFGTSPEKLKQDANNLLDGRDNQNNADNGSSQAQKPKYPRLK